MVSYCFNLISLNNQRSYYCELFIILIKIQRYSVSQWKQICIIRKLLIGKIRISRTGRITLRLYIQGWSGNRIQAGILKFIQTAFLISQ